MATVISSYSPHTYHQSTYANSTLPLFYNASPVSSSYYQARPQKQQTASQILNTDYVDSISQTLRPRREPRIHRQVIVLPTPEPIYRQVRHRLPTPERGIIQRTIIQKANGDVVVQQERHRKKTRSHSQVAIVKTVRSSRTRQLNTD
jgi:hypothetical protein